MPKKIQVEYAGQTLAVSPPQRGRKMISKYKQNNIDVLNLGLSTGTLTPSTEIQLGMSCTIFIKEGDVF